MGCKMVYNFQDKDENTRRNLYLLSLKASWKGSQTFFSTVYPNKTHVTTHPDYGYVDQIFSHPHVPLGPESIDQSYQETERT